MSEEFRAKVRDAFTGPVCSLPTPFKKDNTIDYDTAAQIIDFQIENGFKVIFLTPGNSHYNCISDDEMAEVYIDNVRVYTGLKRLPEKSFSKK